MSQVDGAGARAETDCGANAPASVAAAAAAMSALTTRLALWRPCARLSKIAVDRRADPVERRKNIPLPFGDPGSLTPNGPSFKSTSYGREYPEKHFVAGNFIDPLDSNGFAREAK